MASTDLQVRLSPHEGRLLAAHIQRLRAWDPAGVIRVLARGRALGVYSAPPMGVIAFAALPLAEPVLDPADVTMTLTAAYAALHWDGEGGSFTLIEDAPAAPALATIPPAEGWHLPIQGVAGDVLPQVEESIAEFRSRAALVHDTQVLAEQIWDRPSFGGLPLRMLHAASRLGFLTDDGSRVTACTTSGWKRLTTVRGQVFVKTIPPGQRPLKVVR